MTEAVRISKIKSVIEETLKEKYSGSCPFVEKEGECYAIGVNNCSNCSSNVGLLKDGFYILIVDNVKCAAMIKRGIVYDTIEGDEGYTQDEYPITYVRFIEEL